jgi:hypothetical protein
MRQPEDPDARGEAMTDPDEIKAEIDRTRAELAETANALAARLDVKAQARDKAQAAGERIAAKVEQVRESAPEPVQNALGKAEQAAQPVLAKAAEDKQRTAVTVGGVLVLLVLVRRLRKRTGSRAAPQAG